MTRGCSCEAWRVNAPKVNNPIVLQSIRAGRDLYDGLPFRFCPWCGRELSEEGLPPTNPLAVPPGVAPVNLTNPMPLHCNQCHAIIWPHIGYGEDGVPFTYFHHECHMTGNP